jgi:acetolactate synthase-1/2/3 large subunit
MSRQFTGADAICAALKASGVDTVFGVPGTQTVHFYESLRKSGIDTVTATHELAATFMAQGYFRASGRLAAVSVIPGPGFAFALAALPEAHLDSAALVVLTGQPPLCVLGRRRAQAIDQATIAGPVVKAVIDVADVAQTTHAVRSACALALSDEPGPVLVQFAAGIFTATINASEVTADSTASIDQQDIDALTAAVDFVMSAKSVLFYVGQGAADVAADLGRVIEALGALVATTPSGRGIVSELDDRLLPLDATGDVATFNSIAAQCDAIVVLGAALAENGSVGFRIQLPSDRLVRADISAAVLALPPAARFPVRASSRRFVAALLDALTAAQALNAQRGFSRAEARALRAKLSDSRTDGPSDARIGGGEARAFFASLQSGLPADSCLVLDSGMHQLLARRHFAVLRPRGILFPSDFQSMAFGLPAAIGAKLAHPDRAVVALIGDGAFSMAGLELRTAVRLGLSLPVIVFADQALGLIRLDQLLSHGRAHGTDLGPLDYESMAAAVGCSFAVANINEIAQLVRDALRRVGPTLIVVPVGDAPALKRIVRRKAIRRMVESLVGPRVIGALRRLRGGSM